MMKKSLLLTIMLLSAVFIGTAWGQNQPDYTNHGFEDDDLEGMTMYECHTNSRIGSMDVSLGYGARAFHFTLNTYGVQYLISPEFENNDGVTGTFVYGFTNNTDDVFFKVGYSTSVSIDIESFVWNETPIYAVGGKNEFAIDYSSITNIKYIAIQCQIDVTQSSGEYLYIDTFEITGASKVDYTTPNFVEMSDITKNSAVCSWVGESDASFNVRCKEYGAATYLIEETTNNMTYPLEGLDVGKKYVVSIQAVYEGNHTSNWTTEKSFYTDCDDADKCKITYVLTDEYDNWEDGAAINVVDDETGTLLDVWTIDDGSAYVEGDLAVCNGKTISFVWVKGTWDDECGFVIYDPSGVEIISVDDASKIDETPFATYTMNCPSCERPQNIVVTNITKNSADISWSGSNDSYTVEKRALNELSIQRFENTADISEWQMVNKSQNDMGVYKSVDGEKLARTGNKGFLFASFDYADDPNQFLVSPVINDLGTTVAFYYKNVNGMETEVFRVGYSTKENPDVDNDDDWNWDSSINVPENDTEWHLYTRELPAGTKHVAINYMSDYLYYLAVDDFGIYNGTWAEVDEVDEVNEEEINLVNLESNVLYSVRVQGNCTSETSDYSDIISFTTPIVFTENGHWDETAKWSTGTTPSIYDYNVVINASVTIPDNITATAANITLDGGSITIEDGGQLICSNSVAATVKKSIENADAKDAKDHWYTISAPVHTDDYNYVTIGNETTVNLTNNGAYDMFAYEESTHTWLNQKNNGEANGFDKMYAGQGYMYRNSGNELSYVGNTTVGPVNIALSYTSTLDVADLKGFNLIGNPYTHSIAKGAGKAIDNTKLSSGCYALTNSGTWTIIEDGNEIKPNQGVLVEVSETVADFQIKDINYVAPTPDPGKYKNDNIKFIVESSEYSDAAYAWFDKGIGLTKINHRNENAPMLYIPQDDNNYAIATMTDDTKAFNLNFKAATAGKYTLSYKATGNYNYLHVIDRLTGADVDMLLEGEYSFIGTPKDSENRFIVRLEYMPNYGEEGNDIFAYQSGSDIYVSGQGELQIFDVTGRRVMTTTIYGAESINLSAQGVYIFKLNEKVQKIVVR